LGFSLFQVLFLQTSAWNGRGLSRTFSFGFTGFTALLPMQSPSVPGNGLMRKFILYNGFIELAWIVFMTKKARILVVDDEEQISEIICAALSSDGYVLSRAFSGEQGVNAVRKEKFDLVIMDIQMPGMDGISALGEIKKIDPETEAIIITAYGSMSTAIQSMRKGAFDYLHKPFNIAELRTVVERALEKKKFNDITKAIFSTIRSEELLSIIIDSVTRILKADESLLVLINKTGKPYIAVSYGLDGQAREKSRLEVCTRILHRLPVDDINAITLVDEPFNDAKFTDIALIGEIKFAMILPLMEGNRLTGLININRKRPNAYFTENDTQRAKVFGSLVNLALRNANLYRQLQETQSQLIQAEKMSVLGQMSGGLAHEINNPISGILGLTQLLLEKEERSTQSYKDLKDIEKAVFRCKKIITSLLSFARQDESLMSPINVNEPLEETLTLCAHQMELQRITIVRKSAEGLPMINADFQQLMQVFLNLLTNARDAMPDGGTITISTRPAQVGDKEGVEITIADTGVGIPTNMLTRVFDPFFTTKPVGRGTGLGLSVCLGIINKHSGTITAQSEPGKGSAFTLIIPT